MFSSVLTSTLAGIVILKVLYSIVMSSVFLACGSGCSCNPIGGVTSKNFALLFVKVVIIYIGQRLLTVPYTTL